MYNVMIWYMFSLWNDYRNQVNQRFYHHIQLSVCEDI